MCWLHRLPHHTHQVIAQGVQVCLVSQFGGEGFKSLSSVVLATVEAASAASLQYVRKISGFNKPSKANEVAFYAAVDEIAAASSRLLTSLETNAPPRNREVEAAKARARATRRFAS